MSSPKRRKTTSDTKVKIAIVTGANKGLGYAMVKLLCKKFDGKVYLTSRNVDLERTRIEDLKNEGLKPTFHQLDITNSKSIDTFKETIKNNNEEIRIIINNVSVFYKDFNEDRIFKAERVLSVNFFALVNFTEAMLPLVGSLGNIVNISSSSGHWTNIHSLENRKKFTGDLTLVELKSIINGYFDLVKRGDDLANEWSYSPYVVSKVAANCYTFMLQKELENKFINVNCVHPGYVILDMTDGISPTITSEQAARLPVDIALTSLESFHGCLFWHDGNLVLWYDDVDPRRSIDNYAIPLPFR